MKTLSVTLFAVLCAASPAFAQSRQNASESRAASPSSEQAQIVLFLKTHVNGRTFTRDKATVKISGGKQEADVEVSLTFAGLTETQHGFYFDRETTRKQTNYDLDEAGKRTGKKYVKDSHSVERHFLGARKSTGKVLGYATTTFTTGDWPYAADMEQMRLEGEKLVLARTSALYEDLYGRGDQFRAGRCRIVETFVPTAEGVSLTQDEFAYEVAADSVEAAFDNPWKIESKHTDTVALVRYRSR